MIEERIISAKGIVKDIELKESKIKDKIIYNYLFKILIKEIIEQNISELKDKFHNKIIIATISKLDNNFSKDILINKSIVITAPYERFENYFKNKDKLLKIYKIE